jgi:serine protease
MVGAELETTEATTSTASKVSATSNQIAGVVKTFVTETESASTASFSNFIIGYNETDENLTQAMLESIHFNENKFLDSMSMVRYDREADHPLAKTANFDTFTISTEVLTSYDNNYQTLVQAMNDNFLASGGTGNEIAYIEPNYAVQAFSLDPDDSLYSDQWNMQESYMNIAKLHSITSGDSDIVVAVIDTGVYEEGEDFSSDTFVTGYNFCSEISDPRSGSTSTTDEYDTTDDNGHGTHVTGTIAEETDNSTGAASIAPGITIMPIKALDSDGEGYTSDISDAIKYAADQGVDIINLSLGSSSTSTTLEAACTYAYEKGVFIVAAAGNEDTSTECYPAAYSSVLSVGAVGYDTSKRASYSNYGDWVDVMAYGGENDTSSTSTDGTDFYDGILQWTIDTTPNGTNGYIYYMGTSMATPHVTALAALLLSEDPSRTPDELMDIICKTANQYDDTESPYEMGKYGVIDALAAMQYTAAQSASDTASISITEDETESSSWTLSATEGEISVSLTVESDYLSSLSMALYDEEGNLVASAEGADMSSDSTTISMYYTLEDSEDEGIYTLTVTYSGTSG